MGPQKEAVAASKSTLQGSSNLEATVADDELLMDVSKCWIMFNPIQIICIPAKSLNVSEVTFQVSFEFGSSTCHCVVLLIKHCNQVKQIK